MKPIQQYIDEAVKITPHTEWGKNLATLPAHAIALQLHKLCKSYNLRHTAEYINDSTNHIYIIHELENRGMGTTRGSKSQSKALQVAHIPSVLSKMGAIAFLIQKNQLRAQNEIFANSLEVRMYIQNRLLNYYRKLNKSITL